MISIVIPFFNAHDVIGKCLEPLLGNNDISEIIIIDDCSDEALTIFHPKVKISRHNKNLGPGHCRNIGQKKAMNHLVFFLDSDVVVTDQCITFAKEKLIKGDCDVVIGKVKNISYKDFFSYYKNFYIYYQLTYFNDCYVDFIYGSFCATNTLIQWPEDMRYAEDNYMGKILSLEKRIFLSKQVEFTHLKQYSFLSMLVYDFKIAFGMSRVFLLKRDWSLKFSHSNSWQLLSMMILAGLWIALFFQFTYAFLVGFLLWVLGNGIFFYEINSKTRLNPLKAVLTTFFGQSAQGWGALMGMVYYGVRKK